MDNIDFVSPDALAPNLETAAKRLARVEREKAIIAQAEADIEAGLGLEWEAVEQWLDALDHDENTPPPKPTGSRPTRA